MANTSVTRLLDRARTGDATARNELLNVVYAELRSLAGRHMRAERQDHTLQPTALVNEAYLRLFDNPLSSINDRNHFFAIASTEMRRVLLDHARAHRADKRGGGVRPGVLDDADLGHEPDPDAIIELYAALDRLAALKPDAALALELTGFGGLTQNEAALEMGFSVRHIKRLLLFARSFMLDELDRSPR